MTYIFKYAWLAILIIFYAIWTAYVIIGFKEWGFDCFDEDHPCSLWLISHVLGIFIASLVYFLSS